MALALFPNVSEELALIAVWENEGGSVIFGKTAEFRVAPRIVANASRAAPTVAFLNDLGVPRIMVGVLNFECIGASPPHDHPHIFLEMGESGDILCPYCVTRFTFDGTLARRETRPPNCCYQLVGE